VIAGTTSLLPAGYVGGVALSAVLQVLHDLLSVLPQLVGVMP
jgi:ABC-type dipeptide/oligopeptide/nickel transport system permease subunit